MAVYGWYVAPIGLKLTLPAWGCALLAFLVTDCIKVRGYRLPDPQGHLVCPVSRLNEKCHEKSRR